jgi:hypothetical protein
MVGDDGGSVLSQPVPFPVIRRHLFVYKARQAGGGWRSRMDPAP